MNISSLIKIATFKKIVCQIFLNITLLVLGYVWVYNKYCAYFIPQKTCSILKFNILYVSVSTMAAVLFSSLGLDKEDLKRKFIFISEEQPSEANFILSSFLWKAGQEESNICLLALHNSFNHYHNVSLKLGFNLTTLQETGHIVVIEPMKNIVQSLIQPNESDINYYTFANDEHNLKQLFLSLKETIERLSTKKIYFIIDDVSDLLALGVSVKNVILFVKYCNNLINTFENLTFVVCSHFSECNEQQQVLMNAMCHLADITISVSGLKTGFSADITGSILISHKALYKQQKWNRPNLFHFKLMDRQIKVFALGSIIT